MSRVEVKYITLRFPFHVVGEDSRLIYWTAWLCRLCAHRLLGAIKENPLLANLSQLDFIRLARRLCYDIMSNRRYLDDISTLIHASFKVQKH